MGALPVEVAALYHHIRAPLIPARALQSARPGGRRALPGPLRGGSGQGHAAKWIVIEQSLPRPFKTPPSSGFFLLPAAQDRRGRALLRSRSPLYHFSGPPRAGRDPRQAGKHRRENRHIGKNFLTPGYLKRSGGLPPPLPVPRPLAITPSYERGPFTH